MKGNYASLGIAVRIFAEENYTACILSKIRDNKEFLKSYNVYGSLIEDLAVETEARNGNCFIFQLNLQRAFHY
jgi:hypothetical protein